CRKQYFQQIAISCRLKRFAPSEELPESQFQSVIDFLKRPQNKLVAFILAYLLMSSYFQMKNEYLSSLIDPYRVDFHFAIFNAIITDIITLLTLVWIVRFLNQTNFFANTRLDEFINYISDLNLYLKFFVFFLLNDFLQYWSHRLRHEVKVVWRFHKVHHTTEKLEWQSRFRGHPVSTFLDRIFVFLPTILLGFKFAEVASTLLTFRVIYDCFVHSSYKGDLQFLKYILVTPKFHRLHHLKVGSGEAKNFATIFPLWDIVFGTSSFNENYEENFGVKDKVNFTFKDLFLYPFR
ncbi:MAG: sterol desaturase family protein, partial [Bacteriovorax sp.]|nr:sterol desaturase family protein [Bacteriovorax sp.]